MDMTNVYFKWSSDEINKNSNKYMLNLIDISKRFNIQRLKWCCRILGRLESNDMATSNIICVNAMQ